MARAIRLRVRLIWPEVAAIQICILTASVLRGFDYLIPPDGTLSTLSVIERLAPVEVWGALFLAGGSVGLVGLWITKWPLASLGHVICLGTYAAFAVGAFFEVFSRQPVEGWRTPFDWLLVFVIVHWGFADASIDEWREKRHRAAADS